MVYIYSILYRLLLYPYLIHRGRQALRPCALSLLHRVLMAEFSLALVGVLIHRWIVHPLMSLYMTIGLFVFFSLGYASVFVLGMNALRLLDKRYGGPYHRLAAGTRRICQYAVGCIAVLIFGWCLYWGHHNVRYPEVVRERLHINRLTPPDSTEKHRLRLALLTDLHIGEGITPDYVERAVEQTLAEHPDLILVGGDYIDHSIVYGQEPSVIEAMSRLRAPYGTYYVLGNHEYRADTLANIAWVERVGGTLLLDSVAYPADSLVALIGRDDYVHRSRKPLAQLTTEIAPSRPCILLEHTPDRKGEIKDQPIDLALYGHTHGGQLWPMQALIHLKYGVVSGRYDRDGKTIHVSSGVGAAGAPYRIGTRSQIIIYDLYW